MKKKERSSSEYLKAEIRKLNSQIKRLKQELASHKKYERNTEYEPIKKDNDKKCPKCEEGILSENELGNLRKIITCNECDYRNVKKWKKN